jgi:hypothetical protein
VYYKAAFGTKHEDIVVISEILRKRKNGVRHLFTENHGQTEGLIARREITKRRGREQGAIEGASANRYTPVTRRCRIYLYSFPF